MLQLNYLSTFPGFISSSLDQLKNATKFFKIIPVMIFGAFLFMGVVSNASAQAFSVDRVDDEDVSACTTAQNDCTLRGAITAANAISGSSVSIFFDPQVFSSGRTIVLTGGELSITINGSLTLNFLPTNQITIDGNNQFRPFKIGSQSIVTINNFVIKNGNTQTLPERGGGILNTGTLVLNSSTIENNVSGTQGGGIYNEGNLTISDSTIRNNSALTSGGGIYNTGGIVNIGHSTINNNSSGSSGGLGGGIANSGGEFSVINSTVYGNEGNNGGGIGNNNGTFTLISSTVGNNLTHPSSGVGGGVLNSGSGSFDSRNSIIAGNFAPNGEDFSGTLNSLGYNLIQDPSLTTIIGNTTGNILGQDPLLDPNGLQDNGGETKTIALVVNSPAIDAADPENFPTYDQRGRSRPADGDNNGSLLPDIGAFEKVRTLIVTVISSSDGVCDENCSLSEAIADANSTPTEEIIIFDPKVFDTGVPITMSVAGTILNSGRLTIIGPGMNQLILSSGFNVNPAAWLTVSNLTITRRSVNRGTLILNYVTIRDSSTVESGGAIYNYAALTVNNSIIRNNTANDSGGGIFTQGGVVINNSIITNNSALREGGGIRGGRVEIYNSVVSNNTAADGGGITCYTSGTSSIIHTTIDGNHSVFGGGLVHAGNLSIVNSTISNNISTDGAGGIFYRTGTLNLTNSTISGNSAVQDGGGINNRAIINMTNSTIARNSSASGGGIINLGGTFNARNSIIADNSSEDFFGTITSNGYNLIGNTNNTTIVGTNLDTNIIGADPQLLPLRNYGGQTKTHALRTTSPAIDKGLLTDILSTIADQRGRLRPFDFPTFPNAPKGDGSDIGAFERQATEVNGNSPVDFDGDGKTDISIFRPSAGEWWYLRSTDGGNRAFQFGSSTDKIVPADFTGDGKTDVGVWRESSGEWFVMRSEDNSFYSFPFGTSGDIPLAADFDGDGFDNPAVFRPSSATWYILNSDGGATITTFGASGDKPAIADYDGDGKADLAIYRPASGEWWINRSQSQTTVVYNFGVSTDKAVPADYTGDGKADVAFFRPLTGEWFVLRSEDSSFYSFPFGTSGDIPVTGDYDGDGVADPAVFRSSNATWYLLQSTNGFAAATFGLSGDQPVPSAFVP